ncbi:MAG: WD40 repeat domain-containing protein, partial [Anaerolineae bacterium]|nr:WD40 repeat domain-containing protein [Anaerolineae bacterium]
MKARYALLLLIFLGACTSSQPVMTETPTGTAFVAQVTPIDTETIPKAPQPPRPTKHVPTPTVYPASIIRPPTYVRDGTQLPRPAAAISAENASRLVELARWGKGDARAVAYSPDGREVAVATSQGVYFYDAVSYELLHFTVIEIARGPIALSTSLGQVALGTEIGMLVIWDTSSGAFVRKISASEKSINAIAFSPDGKRLYSSDRQNSEVTKVWDVESGVLEGTRKHGAEQFAFSSDGEVMAALDGGRVYVGNAGDDVDLKSFVPHQNPGEGDSDTYTFALSPDGKYVAIGTMYNMRVLIWWIADNTLLHDIRIGKSLTYTSGGLLASPVFRTGPGDNVVTGLAFNPDGKTIA